MPKNGNTENNRRERRKFLKIMGGVAGAFLIGKTIIPKLSPSTITGQLFGDFVKTANASKLVTQTPLPGKSIPKYVDLLPHFVGSRVTGTTISVNMNEFQIPILPASIYAALPAPYDAGTYVWGYNVGGTGNVIYLGTTVEATKGTSTTMQYRNNLPVSGSEVQKRVTIDQTLHWADPLEKMMDKPMVPYTGTPPTVVHLHGGEVSSTVDGGPDQWYTPDGIQGKGYYGYGAPAYGANYTYPNVQEAATLWFHDHSLGVTRTNVYSGLAAFYFLRDSFDTGLANNPLNLPAGNYEIELAIQDRQFDTNGQLLFPDGFPAGLMGPPPNPTIHPYWIPEFFGDVMVVNGRSWPKFNVEPRRYRFRFLNGCNARFLELQIDKKVPFWQIGTDGGLLDNPVMIPMLLIAPGERADVIVDFAPLAGKTVVMTNSAKAPYPNGATADPQTTGQVMQFIVGTTVTGGTDTSFNPTAVGATLRGGTGQPPIIQRLVDPALGTANVTPDVIRQLTLKEIMGMGGPVEVLVNNVKWNGKRPGTNAGDMPVPITNYISNGLAAPATAYLSELPTNGSTERWEIINLTADAHPIHLHLVQFQLMNRQNFQLNKYLKAYNLAFPGGTYDGVTYAAGVFIPAYGPPADYFTPNVDGALGGNPAIGPYLQGKVMPPNPNEAGWKDTVIMYPGQVTRIMVRFAPQAEAIGSTTPGTNYYGFDPTTGPGYVWHCHIIDHEDNEMMRPYHPVPL